LNEVETGGIQVQPAIDNVIRQLGDLAGAKPIAIVAAFPAHFPRLSGDEPAFRAALSGLLSHVITSTERDEVRVRVQLIPTGLLPIPETQTLRDSYASTGPWGLISISDQDGAFTSSAVEGRGVRDSEPKGTSPTYQECEGWIEQMGGAVWTEHQEPASITIWLALPLMAITRSDADISSVREAVGTHLSEGDIAGRSIQLFTEDDSLSEQLTLELVNAGYRVVVCQTAADVIPMARSESPDLVILDLQAREPSAFDMARLLKQDPTLARTPVLFLTTIPDPKGGYRMDTAGFLVRSEGTGAMLATVHTALSSGVPPAARVLVVEPIEALREQMIVHIQAQGHPVVEAGSAEEAVALVERTRIGVVLANAQSAQARDYWLIRQIKSIASELKIYVISESLSEKDGQEAILRGASGFGDTGRLPELLKRIEGDKEDAGGS
jgi:DNA-binding response OmpR family regulator